MDGFRRPCCTRRATLGLLSDILCFEWDITPSVPPKCVQPLLDIEHLVPIFGAAAGMVCVFRHYADLRSS